MEHPAHGRSTLKLRLRRRGLAAGLGLALVATACDRAGPGDTSEIESVPAIVGTTYAVGVDGTTDEFTGMFFAFFPDRLTVHPGDTVVFRRPDNGVPHTVTLGTDAPTDALVPGGDFFEGGVGGAPRADASMPCFLLEGRPPPDGCSSAEQEPVPFDGTQSWFNSGGLLADEEFSLELASDIAPGSYPFVCLVHLAAGMQGTIEVVRPEEPADDPAEVVARSREAEEEEVGSIRDRVENPPILAEGSVAAGMTTGSTTGAPPAAWANVFSPDEVEIPVGGTVAWTVSGVHTVSFNAPERASPFYERAEDRSVRKNELAAEPQGDPSGWDGSGFLNSGLRVGPNEFTVTFTEAGTYAYRCLFMVDMEGTVSVGE
jgi:plastocyanin